MAWHGDRVVPSKMQLSWEAGPHHKVCSADVDRKILTHLAVLGLLAADGRFSLLLEPSSLVSFSRGRPLPLFEFLYLFFFA